MESESEERTGAVSASTDTYMLGYSQGYDAGAEYAFPAEWQTLYLGYGRRAWADPYFVGWARGFRHACMDRA